MSIKQITVAAVAALGLSLVAYSASAGPVTSIPAQSGGNLLLVAEGGTPHTGGGNMTMHNQGGTGATMHHPSGGRTAMNCPGGGERVWHGHRGYWRGGRWYAWGRPIGGTCFSNCIARGFGPGYCRANAFRFC